MTTTERFFRRYIFSTVGIVVLFFTVNVLLTASYFVIAYFGGVATSNFPIEDFSNHVMEESGKLNADMQAQKMLNEADAWAMLLADDGAVVWEENLPEELPRNFSTTDVAMFSRWYLNDYPINIWKRQDGLLVVGLPAGSVANYYISVNSRYIRPFMFGLAAVFFINVLLMVYLFIRNAHRIEKSMKPILDGIQHLSDGKPVRLPENGKLAEINASLNKAGDYLQKKDNTRAEWIRGISHDIRTPLSMILGYASEMEDTVSLPENTRKQAEIIRRQSEKLKDLVADLNLTTKLEYSVKLLQKQNLDPIELARQVISELLNDGLPEQYELEFSENQPGKNILMAGDPVLLGRMLNNLIRNCITHNPAGCKISISIGSFDDVCSFSIMDNGRGIKEPFLKQLNHDVDISSTQKQTEETEHGLGLKIVRQIVKAHQGTIRYSNNVPHGLAVMIRLPLES